MFDGIRMQPDDRGSFLNLAGLLEGGLLLLACLLGMIPGINPLAHLHFTWEAAAWGVAGAVPMFLLFLVAQRIELGPVRRIRRFLQEALAPPLAACRWYDLILLAALAGIAEEALFRGLLQVWIEQWADSHIGGLIGSNILFGLAHSVSMTYAGLAGVMGVYLGWLFDATGERNLLTPIITHALYDYLAFLVVVRSYRRELRETAETE